LLREGSHPQLSTVDQPTVTDAHRKVTLPEPVPILMYHHIAAMPSTEASQNILFVSPEHFESQLRWLAAHGYTTVSLDDVVHPVPMVKKPIILTFDDGYEDAYTQAYLLLQRYGFAGTFYLVVRDLDRPGFLNDAEIHTMQAAGMRFGSHSITHPDLTTIPELQALREIYESRRSLERLLGVLVVDFCYPGGLFNPAIETFAASSGYMTATTTVNQTNAGAVDLLQLNRLGVQDDTDIETLLTEPSIGGAGARVSE